ncbi:hypothetical protein GYO_3393 [Bacillus spizizenii TU-B-10]|uniref:Uncharacterized protein n=1 Tax=Bacillus spizizenii (strain DSM 15029 / JCM 12233 / NBRC 101239 / NRRL B-23049 / TU-B-10) TaxID=1052585 RepID=G4NZZ3_BACS4|nr:hypothetical protein GYO_3393 [Bacillus spizizenii TU-B-10]SCV39461.1 hypothetical protein BQ1740_0970 [Bacillus subtilis]
MYWKIHDLQVNCFTLISEQQKGSANGLFLTNKKTLIE